MGIDAWFGARVRRHNAYLREIDKTVLWPSICMEAGTEARARNTFLTHTFIDPAWRDLTDQEKFEEVLLLPWPVNAPSLPRG